jgi:hypothetical protein
MTKCGKLKDSLVSIIGALVDKKIVITGLVIINPSSEARLVTMVFKDENGNTANIIPPAYAFKLQMFPALRYFLLVRRLA